jgi:hypothetical protein
MNNKKKEHTNIVLQKTHIKSLYDLKLFSGGIINLSLIILSFLLRLFLKVIQNHLH